MKTIFTFFVVLTATLGYANDEKYVAAMKKNIEAVYQAKTIEEYQQVINTLDRIASAEKTKWEPHYYKGFAYVMISLRETDAAKKDAALDLAMEAVNKGKELLPNDSEMITLEGFVHMIRLSVDPASRGPKYAGLASQLFSKASAINPENPRALSMLAQMQYGTAQFFGSPTTEACNTLNKSLEKFETFKSENPLAPVWGKAIAEEMKEKCQ